MNNMWRTVEIMAEGYHLLCVQSPKVNMTRFFLEYGHQSVASWRKAEE